MLCKQSYPGIFPAGSVFDHEKIGKIRDKIRIVFGSDCAIDDYELSKKYTLTESGELVMIVRGFR